MTDEVWQYSFADGKIHKLDPIPTTLMYDRETSPILLSPEGKMWGGFGSRDGNLMTFIVNTETRMKLSYLMAED